MHEEHFGPYRLLGLLGRGTMGEVHRAFDTRRQRLVALKTLSPQLRTDPTFQARFEREAGAAARLRNPHVVPIHDFGVIEGHPFIDMRLIEGTDLQAVLRRGGPLRPDRAASVVGQVASALDAAHAEGLVHRDVKPSNVLLTEPAGFAYLIDFGLVQHAESTNLTAAGGAIGSLAYMAPERFRGAGDHRADVYALACLLFEALTGQPPFRGDELPAMMHAHLTLPVPRPSLVRPGLPPAVDRVVAVGMSKAPEHRFGRAGELAAAAAAAVAGSRPPVPVRAARPPAPPGRRWGRPAALALAGLALAAGVVGFLVLDRPAPVPGLPAPVAPVLEQAPRPAAVVGGVRVGASPRNAAVSANGRLVFVTNREDDSVSVIDAASGATVRTIALEPGSGPEGIAVAGATGLVYVVNNGSDSVAVLDPVSGSVQRTVVVGGFPTDVAASPDGAAAYVAANFDGRVLVVDAGEEQRTLLTAGAPQSLTVSADGRTAYVTDAREDALLVVDTASGAVTGRVAVGDTPDGVDLSPDERTAYVVNINDDTVSVVDLAAAAVRATIAVGDRPIAVAVHPDGRSAFVTGNQSDTLSVIDTAVDRVRQDLDVGTRPEAVVVSPDGDRVYVVNAGDGTLSVVDPAPG